MRVADDNDNNKGVMAKTMICVGSKFVLLNRYDT